MFSLRSAENPVAARRGEANEAELCSLTVVKKNEVGVYSFIQSIFKNFQTLRTSYSIVNRFSTVFRYLLSRTQSGTVIGK